MDFLQDNFVFIFLGVIVLGIIFRLLAGSFDRDRIRKYAISQDWTVTSIEWEPLAKGWFGSENERFYRVTYRDRTGQSVTATCKTSMLAGVYFTNVEEKRPQRSPVAPNPATLGAEKVIDCQRCGHTLAADAVYCSYCGGKV